MTGFVIKNFIALKNTLNTKITDPEKVQEKQLRWLLNEAKDTAFGKHYNFANILDADDIVARYQQEVPVFEYDEMNEKWWQEQQRTTNITWKGEPKYYALSSGTTGDSKRIPVTSAMLECMRSVGMNQVEALANFDLASDFFGKEILMLTSSTALEEKNGHLEGEISGISFNHLPAWFKKYCKPGAEIAGIADWDVKAQLIAEKATEWDISAMSGIPFWVLRLLKKIVEYHELNTIHDIWPNLRLYTSGGVAFAPYQEELNRLTARPVEIIDTYLASEGFLAYNARPDTMSMKLAMNNGIFFEFIPFDTRGFDARGNILDKPLVLTYSELEEQKDYALLISTPAGAWRYMIGDMVKFTSLERFEVVLSGRTKYFLNVVGAQLTEERMTQAIKQLSTEMGVEISEYSVAAIPNESGEYYHQWVLGTDGKLDKQAAAHRLDELLQLNNKNYSSSRSKVLKYLVLDTIPKELFYEWLGENNRKSGQVKVPKVMSAERMLDLIAFIERKQFVGSVGYDECSLANAKIAAQP